MRTRWKKRDPSGYELQVAEGGPNGQDRYVPFGYVDADRAERGRPQWFAYNFKGECVTFRPGSAAPIEGWSTKKEAKEDLLDYYFELQDRKAEQAKRGDWRWHPVTETEPAVGVVVLVLCPDGEPTLVRRSRNPYHPTNNPWLGVDVNERSRYADTQWWMPIPPPPAGDPS